jgi:arylsulfatase A-like enzyme
MRYLSIIFILLFTSNSFSQHSQAPKLVVGIVIDQMCYDFLYRFQSKFSSGGFKKLMSQGVNCRNTQYNYVPTYTGPGHASIYTGTTPMNHKIVANDWFNRKGNSFMNCVGDSTVKGIGTNSKESKSSPKNLEALTITDQLRMTNKQSKVISLSIKNRSAVLPGGHMSSGSYWFDTEAGTFVSSSYYMDELPSWVQAYNSSNSVSNCMQTPWRTLYPINEYIESNQDDSPYEQLVFGKKSPTFPYDFQSIKQGKELNKAFIYTPYANTHLLNFALSAIQNEELGKDLYSDFLCLSFSSTDILGHAFGPASVEVEDMYLRLDLDLAKLIEALEQGIGKDNFIMFVTADHAVVPVPQSLVDRNLPGGYIFLDELMKSLKTELASKFGADLISSYYNNNIYLNRSLIQSKGIDREKVEQCIVSSLRNWEHIHSIVTSSDIAQHKFFNYWEGLLAAGYDYERSGDVLFSFDSGYLTKEHEGENAHKGTSHGTGFSYDTHVPLLWYGGGLKQQEVFRKIEITDITATLTHILNLSKPSLTVGEPILEILNQK